MAVERYTRDPNSRRARSVTQVTIKPGEGLGQDEIAALDEIARNLAGPLLQRQARQLEEFMEKRGWPTTLGRYWANEDGSRWQRPADRAEARPDWGHAGRIASCCRARAPFGRARRVRHAGPLQPAKTPA